MNTETACAVGFSHVLGIGPVRFALLKSHFGSAEAAYFASYEKIAACIGRSVAEVFETFRSKTDLNILIGHITEKKIIPLAYGQKGYPEALKNIPDPPICLYARGNLAAITSDSAVYVAVVGTRQPTSYGIQITELFSSRLSQAGCSIVSGLARGVDAVAHTAALDAGGSTVAFLGCGVDVVYPRSNAQLYERIINEGGLIISEFPPGRTVSRGLFVARNRLISGLSSGILVIEGTNESGSLITARYAAEQGKEVFAPPAPLTSRFSAAPNRLIKQGARMVTTAEEILQELRVKPLVSSIQSEQKFTAYERDILTILRSEACTSDELIRRVHMEVPALLGAVSRLEMARVIERNQDGKYQVRVVSFADPVF